MCDTKPLDVYLVRCLDSGGTETVVVVVYARNPDEALAHCRMNGYVPLAPPNRAVYEAGVIAAFV